MRLSLYKPDPGPPGEEEWGDDVNDNFDILDNALVIDNEGVIDASGGMFRTDDGTGRDITWGASFVDGAVELPGGTTSSVTLRVLLLWDGTIWRCMAADEDYP